MSCAHKAFNKSVPNNYISHLKIWYYRKFMDRIERNIFLPVPSNQIKVTFVIILPFNLVHLWFFPVSHRNWRKRWVDYWGGQRVCCPPPPLILFGGLPPPPPPPAPPLPTPMPPYSTDLSPLDCDLTMICLQNWRNHFEEYDMTIWTS